MRRRRGLIIIAGVAALVFAVVGGRLALRVAAAGTPNGLGLAALTADEHRVAIIFGAGLSPDGTPSPLLDDRLKAGEELYRRGVVDRLLMTGDNSVVEHNEPSAMRRASLTRGIPSDVIAVDYGGRRTYSCNCAPGSWNASSRVERFHAARTVVICRAAGVTVDGVVGVSTGRRGIGDARAGGWGAGAPWRGLTTPGSAILTHR